MSIFPHCVSYSNDPLFYILQFSWMNPAQVWILQVGENYGKLFVLCKEMAKPLFWLVIVWKNVMNFAEDLESWSMVNSNALDPLGTWNKSLDKVLLFWVSDQTFWRNTEKSSDTQVMCNFVDYFSEIEYPKQDFWGVLRINSVIQELHQFSVWRLLSQRRTQSKNFPSNYPLW